MITLKELLQVTFEDVKIYVVGDGGNSKILFFTGYSLHGLLCENVKPLLNSRVKKVSIYYDKTPYTDFIEIEVY